MEPRKEVEDQYKWDFQQVYSSEEEWNEDCEKVREDLEKLTQMEGNVLDSPDSFYNVLQLREDILRRLDKLGLYANMRKHVDMTNPEYQKASSVVDSLRTDVSYQLGFLRPEIINQKEKATNFLDEDERLEKYDQYLERMFRLEQHTRSKEVEEVISKMSELMNTPHTNYSMLVNADIEFPVVEKSDGGEAKISLSNFGKLLKDEDPEFRKEVYDKFYECLGGYSNTIASSLEATIKKNQRLAELRNYKSAKHSSLKSSNIPVEIYDNLLEVAEDNLDALYSHIEMKDEGFDHQIRMCDIARPMEGGEELEISYEEAKEIVLEALKPLGEEYVEVAEKGLNSERWVDVYESENKRSGAYSSGVYDTKPYILMNYQGDLSSVYTLAHELAHSMHRYFATENQPYTDSKYDVIVAETVSKVNELLLTDYLLNNEEFSDIRHRIIDHELEGIRGTFYVQSMFADFQEQIYDRVEEEGGITSQEADRMYAELKYKYYDGVQENQYTGKGWMAVHHFYLDFYVFKYATGISAAKKIVEQIKTGEEGRERYINFLKAGGSKYPIEALRDVGADLENPELFEKIVERYKDFQQEYKDEVQ